MSRQWHKLAGSPTQLAYVKVTMANTRVSLRRRRRAEWLSHDVPDSPVTDHYPVDSAPLWTAVQNLPRRQRAVIVLRYVEGHSEAEIATMLSITPGTVKSQAAKALATLRRTTIDSPAGGLR